MPSSRVVHPAFLALILFGCFAAAAPWANAHGVLFAGAGLLMMLFRPVAAVPAAWWWLAGGFLGCAALALLPVEWTGAAEWRTGLAAAGLETGAMKTAQPRLTAETLGVFAITLVVGLWLAGQRIAPDGQKRVALGFALAIAGYALVSLWKQGRTDSPLFGFFPNRNHTASLLAMGALAGLASLAQAVRDRRWGTLGAAAVASGICLWAVLAWSESRAGLLLIGLGGVAWWLLLDQRYLGSHARKALVLVALAAGGGFLIADSKIKERLEATAGRLETSESGAETAGGAARRLAEIDFRVPIWSDTLEMIRAQPWTGVGAGNFAGVFPQYRAATVSANHADGLHPESDWLWLAAETGVPAALCLAALVVLAAVHGARHSRRHRARALRAGCLVAALLVAVHGIFDVPGHRIPLAWAAALLFSLALPLPEHGIAPRAWPFRLAGLALFGIGAWLMVSADGVARTPAIARGELARTEARRLYREDLALQEKRLATGIGQPPAGDEDRLEQALEVVDRTLPTRPLDRGLWHWKGFLALHYDDKMAEVDRAFAIERALDPHWAGGPLRQARAWAPSDPARTVALWEEALRRADRLDARDDPGGGGWRERVLGEIRAMARDRPELEAAVDRLPDAAGR